MVVLIPGMILVDLADLEVEAQVLPELEELVSLGRRDKDMMEEAEQANLDPH
jgi:hypothetical protein